MRCTTYTVPMRYTHWRALSGLQNKGQARMDLACSVYFFWSSPLKAFQI